MVKIVINKKKKGDIYALALPNDQGYIYIYYIAGNAVDGDLMTIFDYSTKELETNMQKILSQPSLYKQNPFMGNLNHEDSRYTKVGNVKPDFELLLNKPIYVRGSIEYGELDNKLYLPYEEKEIDSGWKAMLNDLKAGVHYYCNDWDFIELRITTLKGKLETMPEVIEVGKLNNTQQDIFTYHIFPNENDYIEKYLTGYDRNSILYSLFL